MAKEGHASVTMRLDGPARCGSSLVDGWVGCWVTVEAGGASFSVHFDDAQERRSFIVAALEASIADDADAAARRAERAKAKKEEAA